MLNYELKIGAKKKDVQIETQDLTVFSLLCKFVKLKYNMYVLLVHYQARIPKTINERLQIVVIV